MALLPLSIDGSLEAPLQHVFSGPGAVRLGSKVPRVHPEWWGAEPTPLLPSRASAVGAGRGAAVRAGRRAPPVVTLPAVRGPGATTGDAAAIQSAIDSIANPDQLSSEGGCTAGGEVIALNRSAAPQPLCACV